MAGSARALIMGWPSSIEAPEAYTIGVRWINVADAGTSG
jgi:hypothetical protein